LGTFQKTDNSRNRFFITKLFIRINAEIDEFSDDMPLVAVAEHSILEEILAIYSMGTHGIPWDSDF
jgi:hypothetical protein